MANDHTPGAENNYLVHDDVPVKAECIHIPGCSCLTVQHGVAWQDRLNIVCLCGKVCSAVIGKNPAGGFIGHPGSDTYVRTPAAQAFADHLWAMNHPPSESPTPPGTTT